MGLVKCPDCEKMVSERVEACPFCGCPSTFFEKTNNTDYIKEKEESDIVDNNKDSKKITFNFKNEKIEYPEGTDLFAKIYGKFSCYAVELFYKYNEKFDNADITDLLGCVATEVEKDINYTIDKSVEYLYSKNIRITTAQFIKKYSDRYGLNFKEKIKDLYNERDRIMEEKELRERQREYEKTGRSRWQGGGFGLSGALKGAATAGLMNMGSDILHSFGDSSRANQDNQIISKKLRNIGNSQDSKELYTESVFQCIKGVFYAFRDELVDAGAITEIIETSSNKAMSIFEATITYEKDPNKFFAGMIESIGLYPDGTVFYDKIFDELHDDDCDYDKFVDFWNIRPLFIYLEEAREKRLKKQRELISFEKELGMTDFDYSIINAEYYLKIRQAIHVLLMSKPNVNIPEKIIEYFQNYVVADGFGKLLYQDWLPKESNLDEFIFSIRVDELLMKQCVTRLFWMTEYPSGENLGRRTTEERVKEPSLDIKNEYESEGDKLLLYLDSSLFGNGKNGIAITQRYIYYLKTNDRVSLKDMNQIKYDENWMGKYILKIGDSSCQFEITLPESFDDYGCPCNRVDYLISKVIMIAIRYAGNTNFESYNSKPHSDYCIYQIEDSLQIQNEEDSYDNEVVVESKYENDNIEKNLEEEINCPKCKNKISKSAKFCNFCGEKMNQVHNSDDSIKCPKCGKNISASAKFCNFCGEKMVGAPISNSLVVCPKCGKAISESAKFCIFCGDSIDKSPGQSQNGAYMIDMNGYGSEW